MSQTVIGIFDSAREAQEAVERLRNSGFNNENIDVSMRDNTESTTTGSSDDDNDSGFGSGISNFFSSLFGSDDEDNARSYSEVAKRGSVLTVHAQSTDQAHQAAEILDMCGAVDIDERAQQYRASSGAGTDISSGTEPATGYGFNTGTGYVTDTANSNSDMTDVNAGTTNYNSGDRINEETSIPIIKEELQVGKREVESGGARLRSKIIERPVEESVRLRSERVNIERNPVNRPATEADLSNFQEGTIEVTEHKEVPIVNKEARVVEEVRLEKEVEEREETVRDTVRSTDVDVERLDSDEDTRNSRSDDQYRRSDRSDDIL